MNLHKLYITLSQRKRPEDVADIILAIPGLDFTEKERKLLWEAARGSLRSKLFSYTSMLQAFAQPIGAEKQIKKAIEIFQLGERDEFDYNNPGQIEAFIKEVSPLIAKEPGKNNFIQDRLNRVEREDAGLDISKRKYNKQWRMLKRLEGKLEKLLREMKKREFQLVGKHGLVHRLSEEDFVKDAYSACFVAYYTARCNLRSRFTIFGQTRAYDEISDMLFRKCTGKAKLKDRLFQSSKEKEPDPNWWAIAHVYPSVDVLRKLTDEQKGALLGKWTALLAEIAALLKEIWESNDIRRESMIVQRGNDSSTWNNTASAWNKARDNWINLLYATGTEYILDELCFGKVLRLMAADVVSWHKSAGNDLEPNTFVWNKLPLPWEVFSGDRTCTKAMVVSACKDAGIHPEKSGWIAPREHGVATFTPTPELVHGVSIADPFLAEVLKRHKYFSGKNAKPIFPESN